MPPKLIKRGDEWCLEEPDGTPIACHETREDAIAQIAATESNKVLEYIKQLMDESEADTQEIIVSKAVGEDGLRFMGLVSSNSFRDREWDIVGSKGLERYAKGQLPTKPKENKLKWWHGGDAIGKIIYAEFYKSFLIEVAQELPDMTINLALPGEDPITTTVKNVWDVIELFPGEWRASIGFRRLGKDNNRVIYPIDKFETSVLVKDAQANWFTVSEVINA